MEILNHGKIISNKKLEIENLSICNRKLVQTVKQNKRKTGKTMHKLLKIELSTEKSFY